MRYILAIDLGTTSMKAVLFDERLHPTAREKKDYETDYPAPGWAEQDPRQWWTALRALVGELLSSPQAPSPSDIAVVAIDAMSPTVIPVDRKGQALRKALIWMDRRAEAECRTMDDELGDAVFRIGGNRNDASNFAPKMRWIKEHEPDIYRRTHRFLGANGFLVHRLTGLFTMDCTQGGLSQLCDIGTGQWNDLLIARSRLDRQKLPEIVESTQIVGNIRPEAAAELGLSVKTRVIAGAMDNVAAGLGAGVLRDQELYLSAGTATNVCLCSDSPLPHPSFHLYRHIVPHRWIHTAGVDYGGAGYKWFARLIGETDYAALDRRAAAASPGRPPLLFLPYMVGQRSPLWNRHTRGVLFGLDPRMGDGEMARSFMEGNAFGIRKILEMARDLGSAPLAGRLTGGCSESRVYSQIIADILNMEVFCVGKTDVAPLGAAMAGAMAGGFFDDFDAMAQGLSPQGAQHHPNAEKAEYYTKAYSLFDDLYKQLEPFFEKLTTLREENTE